MPKNKPPAGISAGAATARDSSTLTKRKVNFQIPHNDNTYYKGEDTFNLPEEDNQPPKHHHHHHHPSLDLVNNHKINNNNSAAYKKPETPFFSPSALQNPAVVDITPQAQMAADAAALTDASFEQRHKSLKDAAWQWATENFSDDAAGGPPYYAPNKITDLPRLCQNHPELAEYVSFLASCPCDVTWEEFFNTRKTFLAFAVLGKVLEVHIFGQEMFGASEAQTKVLRSLDLEMMHQDGGS